MKISRKKKKLIDESMMLKVRLLSIGHRVNQ